MWMWSVWVCGCVGGMCPRLITPRHRCPLPLLLLLCLFVCFPFSHLIPPFLLRPSAIPTLPPSSCIPPLPPLPLSLLLDSIGLLPIIHTRFSPSPSPPCCSVWPFGCVHTPGSRCLAPPLPVWLDCAREKNAIRHATPLWDSCKPRVSVAMGGGAVDECGALLLVGRVLGSSVVCAGLAGSFVAPLCQRGPHSRPPCSPPTHSPTHSLSHLSAAPLSPPSPHSSLSPRTDPACTLSPPW
jgi:hypothetical protein